MLPRVQSSGWRYLEDRPPPDVADSLEVWLEEMPVRSSLGTRTTADGQLVAAIAGVNPLNTSLKLALESEGRVPLWAATEPS